MTLIFGMFETSKPADIEERGGRYICLNCLEPVAWYPTIGCWLRDDGQRDLCEEELKIKV